MFPKSRRRSPQEESSSIITLVKLRQPFGLGPGAFGLGWPIRQRSTSVVIADRRGSNTTGSRRFRNGASISRRRLREKKKGDGCSRMSDRYDRRALRRSPGGEDNPAPLSWRGFKNAGRQYGVKGRCAGVAHVPSRRHRAQPDGKPTRPATYVNSERPPEVSETEKGASATAEALTTNRAGRRNGMQTRSRSQPTPRTMEKETGPASKRLDSRRPNDREKGPTIYQRGIADRLQEPSVLAERTRGIGTFLTGDRVRRLRMEITNPAHAADESEKQTGPAAPSPSRT